ncbi:ABC transporter permease [Halobacillus sp. Marseille-Q1614]|uniref:ABC transporter permease n=1 Tax=Halobacillus sp. Marseille-Q1614 TaxID=2709134 RepID=UPI00156D52DF|nr:ABC transporter permease [Halobacillus sp. Marseille-Q1614]
MNKFLIMVGHTFASRVKTKSFIITTIVTLSLIFLITNIQTIMEAFDSGEGESDQTSIMVLSENEEWADGLVESLNASESFSAEVADQPVDEIKQEVEEGEGDTAALELIEGESGLPEANYYTVESLPPMDNEIVQQSLQQVKMGAISSEAEVDPAVLAALQTPPAFNEVSLGEEGSTAEEMAQTQGVVYVMLFLLYLSVLLYGNMIVTEVATEKSSRVMEILISSVSPIAQMFAKITGIALLGLLQFSLIIGVGYLGIQQNSGEGSFLNAVGLTNVKLDIIAYGLLFFILGYFLYATLAATLGSLVSRLEDAQQMVAPMTYMIIIAFFIAIFGLNEPDATFITVTSYIPFFSPLLMFLRIGMLDIPVWEVILSVGVLVASIVLLAVIGARIYKGGVLMYGRTSSLKDVKKAIQMTGKDK